VDEGKLDHPAEVDRRLLEPGDDAPRLLQPTDEALDDASSPIRRFVELDRSLRAVLVLLARDQRSDPKSQEILVNPVRSIALVTAEHHRPRHLDTVNLTCSQVEVEWMPLFVTEDVNFGAPPTAGAAQCMVFRLLDVVIFSPHLRCTERLESMCHRCTKARPGGRVQES
jgi:hypothetical protein